MAALIMTACGAALIVAGLGICAAARAFDAFAQGATFTPDNPRRPTSRPLTVWCIRVFGVQLALGGVGVIVTAWWTPP